MTQTIDEYLRRTRSASEHLFEALASYVRILDDNEPPIFSFWGDAEEAYREWQKEHKEEIERSLEAQHEYVAEFVAMNAICGAILQMAFHAFIMCSSNTVVPAELAGIVKPDTRAVQFCVGRSIRRVPLGLVVYAGRNQHMHMEDATFNTVTEHVLAELRDNPPERDMSALVVSDCFVVNQAEGKSQAKAFVDVLLWRDREAYERDLRSVL